MRHEYKWPGAEPNESLRVDRGGPAQAPDPRDVPFVRVPVRRPVPPTPARPREFIAFVNEWYGTDSDDMAQRIEATSAYQQGTIRKIDGQMPAPSVSERTYSATNFCAIAAGLPFMPIDGDPDSDFDAFRDPGVTP